MSRSAEIGSSTLHFGAVGDGALGVLVEVVGGVGLDAEVGAAGVSAVDGGLTAVDVGEDAFKLLVGDGVPSAQKRLPEVTWPRLSYW